MKKITLLSVFMIAASAMFAQTAIPGKSTPKGSNQPNLTKPVNTADVKGAGANNPIGKNTGNTVKPVTADKISIKKTGGAATTNTHTPKKN
jgi:hypothetical protein